MNAPKTILCLDLALANTGVAVVSLGSPDKLVFVDTLQTAKMDKTLMRQLKLKVADAEWARVESLISQLEKVVNEFKPDHVFLECPTGGSKSAQAAKTMALARGAACGVTHFANIPVSLVSPFSAKKAATGDSQASKEQVKGVAKALFPDFKDWVKGKRGKIVEGKNEHVYDALSVYMAAKATKEYKDLKNDSGKQAV